MTETCAFYKCLTCGFLLPKPETFMNPGLIIRATCPACGSEGPMRLDEGIEAVKPAAKGKKRISERLFSR